MAEAIGAASGLLTLATFAFQSSIALYNTVSSFKSHQKRVADLIEELQGLTGVLGPLTDRIRATNDRELSALDLPLQRCGNACKDFEQVLLKCLSRSGGSRTSFRDWAKLKYIGDDIDGFRRSLSGYQMTINIALTDANLRKSSANAEVLEAHKAMIEIATDNLQAQLESIDEKLEAKFTQTATESNLDAMEIKAMKEERLSTQKCLLICDQLSEHINQIQLTTKRMASSDNSTDEDSVSEKLTSEGLRECKASLANTSAKLEKLMKDIMDQLVKKSRTGKTSEEDLAELTRLQEEWDTTRKSMNIIAKADTHLKHSVSIIDNYATGDAVQYMVSTNGKVLHGTNKGMGWRTRQIGGYIDSSALVSISRDMSNATLHVTADGNSFQPASASSTPDDPHDNAQASKYSERYGRGMSLQSKDAPSSTSFPAEPAKGGRSGSPKS